MKDLVILGGGSFAKLLHCYLKEEGKRNVAAFAVEKKYLNDTSTQEGLPVVAFETVEELYPPNKYEIIMGIGYSGMNSLRERLFYEAKKKGYYIASFIHSTATIAKDAVIGEGNIIFEKSLIQSFCEIGSGNLIWYDVKIAHNDKIGSFNTFAGNSSLSGFVNIANRCFLGNSCTVINNVNIADETLVGLGAVVKADTMPKSVIVPARSVVLPQKKSAEFI